jgi:hypothetical protein
MANLSVTELLRFDWRIKNFLSKYQSQDKFELYNGQKVKLLYEEHIMTTLSRKNYTEISKLEFQDAKNKTRKYKISSFRKTEEFGGIKDRKSNFIDEEEKEAENINVQLEKIRSVTGKTYVPIRIKDETFNVVKAFKTPGTPKSDIHFTDENGEEVLWISHKKGYLPSQFQQWSGITEFEDHPEVKQFVEDVKSNYPDGIPRTLNIGRLIKDDMLKLRGVYGKQYTGKKHTPYGRDNVSIVVQGTTKIIRDGSDWRIKGHNTFENGKKLTVSYDPILICYYRGDRSNFGIAGARFAIFTKMGKNVNIWL